MKCRIVKKGNEFYAQYFARKFFPGGRRPHSAWVWTTLKKVVNDQQQGTYEKDYFDSEKEAQDALIEYAESHSEGTVVKEFEA